MSKDKTTSKEQKEKKRAKHEHEQYENIFPDRFREINIAGLNYSINLKSTFSKETIDFLLDRAIYVLDMLEKKDGGESK